MKESAAEVGDEIAAVKMQPPPAALADRSSHFVANAAAEMRWLTPFCSTATLLSLLLIFSLSLFLSPRLFAQSTMKTLHLP